MTEKEMLVGLSTAAARRIVQTGKFADGSKAGKATIERLKRTYGIEPSPKPKAQPGLPVGGKSKKSETKSRSSILSRLKATT
jgi:Arc/MetJ-type ribon-helix-helix transcriptional regulator